MLYTSLLYPFYNSAWHRTRQNTYYLLNKWINSPKKIFVMHCFSPSTSLHSSCVFLSNPQLETPDISSPHPTRADKLLSSQSHFSHCLHRGRNVIHLAYRVRVAPQLPRGPVLPSPISHRVSSALCSSSLSHPFSDRNWDCYFRSLFTASTWSARPQAGGNWLSWGRMLPS